jgi:hypothetical protein
MAAQLDGVKRADMDQVGRAKRGGSLITIHLALDLPHELQTQENAGRWARLVWLGDGHWCDSNCETAR